ncbi:hypothetical protein ACVIGB_005362 [Bradyrhizobium sp. USDA 4341]
MAGELPDYGKPDRLYDIGDLLQGYDPSDKLAFVKSWDFGPIAASVLVAANSVRGAAR